MSLHDFALSPSDLEVLSKAGEKLRSYHDEFAVSVQQVLQANGVFHEHLFTNEELSKLSQQSTHRIIDALIDAHMYRTAEKIREQGTEFANQGVGDRSLADVLSLWPKLCLSKIVSIFKDTTEREQALFVTAKALSRYSSLFTEGYIQASRDRILDAQDEMVVALEQSLRESEQWLAITLKSIGDGVIATDTEGIISFMNPVAARLTGWNQEEAVGNHLREVFYIINEETRERCENPFQKIMESGRIVGLANSTVLIAKDGTERLIADSGAPIRDEEESILGTVLVFRDVTEKRKMEDNILKLKTEKMESISILAGGIAHDFNNILTAVLGNVTIAKMHSAPEDETYRLLTEAEKASLRAKDLTQQLLTFSKGGAPIKKPASMAELLKSTAQFALSGSKARCEFVIPDNLWSVEVDAGQISQVINNLVINADQAMPGGGTITIKAENIKITPHQEVPVSPGTYVRITIEDQGIGIPEEHFQRIFDPYFSTKQKGSGLGLATSFSIIKNHEGCITVDSQLGVGTKFHVFLPASGREIVHEEKPRKTTEKKGRILLMDDEESILEATGEVLTYLGYEVEVARDGVEAIELYRKAEAGKDWFDAVIIDLTIKGRMSGKETIQNLLEIDPDVKAIVSSGYSDDPVMANFKDYGFCGVVTKPYTIDELSETLCSVLK